MLTWDSNIALPVCSDCANLLPLPSTANYYFNGDSCLWQCNPGYYIPTTGITPDTMGRLVTTGPVSCVACTACPSGQYTDPNYGGCLGIASSNRGFYGAVINSGNSACRACKTCAAYRSACTQFADAVCV